jgi:8-amino-7-oxononanoate synthase
VDFTSALYLGFEHSWSSLPAWERLTLGKPAALAAIEGTAEIERELAALVGCEEAVLGPSTLHLFWDLFAILAAPGSNFFVDQASYPIAGWGVDLAAAGRARTFAHHDANALRSQIGRARRGRPVVVTDGFCPTCGRGAPLTEYVECVEREGGWVVVDDTQALGIFGRIPELSPPYGSGGGGSLRRCDVRSEAIVAVSSLAKGFGVPVAALGGSSRLVGEFRRRSATRVHCSPPSAAVLAAAREALDENRRCGQLRRRRLAKTVATFREGLRELSLLSVAGLFPVQPLRLPRGIAAPALHRVLAEFGVLTVLQGKSAEAPARVSFIFTAQHRPSEIRRALEALAHALPRA